MKILTSWISMTNPIGEISGYFEISMWYKSGFHSRQGSGFRKGIYMHMYMYMYVYVYVYVHVYVYVYVYMYMYMYMYMRALILYNGLQSQKCRHRFGVILILTSPWPCHLAAITGNCNMYCDPRTHSPLSSRAIHLKMGPVYLICTNALSLMELQCHHKMTSNL